MSLKFGSASKNIRQIQIVKQVAAKKVRFEPISSEDRVVAALKDGLIRPHDEVSVKKLLNQYQELIEVLRLIQMEKKLLPLLIAKRIELCAIMVDPDPVIARDIYIEKREDETQMQLFRLDILTFQLLLAITCLCDTGKHSDLKPIDFRALVKAGLVSDDYAYIPFRSMTLQEIFDCFTTLQQSWKCLEYSNDLPLYLDAIMLRIGYLVCCPAEPNVFANCSAYVDKVGEDYFPNRQFIFDVGWTFIEMYMDVSIQTSLSTTVKPPPFEIAKADRHWLKNQARRIELSENYQTKVMEIVLKHNCFPGEFNRYIAEHKSERFSRTPRYKKIIGARGEEGKAHARSLMEILNTNIPINLFVKSSGFNKTCRDEILLLCLVHWVQRFVEVNFEETFVRIANHCRLNYDSLDQLVKAQGYPVIIQSFNRFNVHYKDTLYTTNSVSKAFLLFFAFIMRYHKGQILNTPLDKINLASREMHSFWSL
jgi:hypothetical protein